MAVLVLVASEAASDETERVDALLVRLGGKDAVDRAAAAKALARLGDGPATAALVKALSDEAEPVRHSAACALAARGDRGEMVVAVLARSLASDQWYLRWEACIALGKMGAAARPATEGIVGLLEDADPLVSRQAALAVPEIAPDDALKALDSERPVDREALLHGLLRVRRVAAVKWLAGEARTNRHRTGESARRSLRRIEPLLGTDTLIDLFDASSPENRARACDRLAWWGEDARIAAAVPYLVAAVADPERSVRCAALWTLASFGVGARPAFPALVRALVDPEMDVRVSARSALKMTGGAALANAIEVSPSGEARLVPPLGELPKDDATLAALAEILKRDKDELRAEIVGAGK